MSNVRSMKRHNLRLSVFLHTLLAVLSLLWLLPVAWLLLSSFRAEPGAYTSYLLPKSYTLDNYVRLFTDTALFNFPRWFLNTLFVACCSCLITTVLSLMVAYGLFAPSLSLAQEADERIAGAEYVSGLHEHDRHLPLSQGHGAGPDAACADSGLFRRRGHELLHRQGLF